MERLTGLDAAFLYLETPRMHMHIAMAALLDVSEMPGGYSFEAVQSLIERQVRGVPALRRRLVQVPLRLHHPVWVDDPNFDIIHHVRRVTCPAPGSLRELGALCGRIASTPLSRSRPLWEAWIIEGLAQGGFALLCKIHHCAVDGTSGANLMSHLFSLERRGAPVAQPVPPQTGPMPANLELFRQALTQRARQPGQLFRLVRKTVRTYRHLVQRRDDPLASKGATPLNAPRTPFNAAITPRRDVAFARISLFDVKTVKNAFGTTVNDVILAVCAGALRRYLERRGELPAAPLIAACPVSVRSNVGDRSSNNQVSTMFTSLATNLEDPVERLAAIRQATCGAKEEHRAVGGDFLQNWAELSAPTSFALLTRLYMSMRLVQHHRPVYNVIVSNVPGPPVPLYLAGAELVAAYPMGPVMEGVGLNITVMSYLGEVDFGFMAAADLMEDVWDLAEDIAPAMGRLLEAARVSTQRAAK